MSPKEDQEVEYYSIEWEMTNAHEIGYSMIRVVWCSRHIQPQNMVNQFVHFATNNMLSGECIEFFVDNKIRLTCSELTFDIDDYVLNVDGLSFDRLIYNMYKSGNPQVSVMV
jgi:hypothetical protein